MSTDDKLLALAIAMNQLRQTVKEMWIQKGVEEQQIPEPIMTSAVQTHYRKRRIGRPLLEGEIKDAMNKFKTMIAVADYLCVHPETLKKYVKLYGLTWKPTRGSKPFKP